ncbi:hypothetical protein B0H66DRAFT_534667 [Apodospora peruviana]|uniref:Uncharacterized protein n=1 Tax=Apodospora peruviana TaxID=516989 RepID=A0AAE0M215_9PEZI|nr:hypothetical protein B0H66DRAFT_534667 [Apodospora peruviana]
MLVTKPRSTSSYLRGSLPVACKSLPPRRPAAPRHFLPQLPDQGRAAKHTHPEQPVKAKISRVANLVGKAYRDAKLAASPPLRQAATRKTISGAVFVRASWRFWYGPDPVIGQRGPTPLVYGKQSRTMDDVLAISVPVPKTAGKARQGLFGVVAKKQLKLSMKLAKMQGYCQPDCAQERSEETALCYRRDAGELRFKSLTSW